MNATPDPPSGPRRPRTTLGRYDLLTRLGSGGMADVYLAVARGPAGFHKLSVLKVLRPRVAQEEDFYAMFLDEARLSANFSHPNVVQTHGVEEDGGQHFLVMEYLEGRSLAQLQAEQRDLPTPLQLRALADALHGLHYVHELAGLDGQPYNVVHRDVSPQNVFVTYDGGAKILDFGVAKARNSLSQTREGTYKGKVSYMAPEQLLGEDIDRRADVFAAGILLFHALTGRRLWEGLDQLTIMHRLATREPVPAPHSLRADVHPALDAACVKALSLRPEDRFDTASELADVLEEYLRPLGAEASHRRLGRFLEERYAADRASFQASVDAHLRALRDAPAATPRGSGSIPAPPLARGSGAASGSIPAPPPARSSGAVSGSIPAPPPARSSGAASGSIPAPPLARGSGAASGSIPAPPPTRGSGAVSGSIPAPPPTRGSGAVSGSIPAPPPTRGSGAAPGSIPAPPLARSSAPPGATLPPRPASIAPAASAPTPSSGPAPAVAPRPVSAPLVLGALLVVIAAGVAPWLPRLWPRLQTTFAPNALTTHAPSLALPSAAPPAPAPPALAASAPAAATPAAAAPPPHEAPPAPAANEARERRRRAPRRPGERAPD